MKPTNLELRMYKAMDAIYRSRIPVVFKGAMVLNAVLYEIGFTETEIRPTKDIEANWIISKDVTDEQIRDALQEALKENGIKLTVGINRKHGPGRSAGFEFCESENGFPVFTMDMDVNRTEAGSREYVVSGLAFNGVVIEQMIADKIYVVSSGKVFRRIKDVIDLFYLSECYPLDIYKIQAVLENNGKTLSTFECFLDNKIELQHAYDKFKFSRDVKKPDFEEVYSGVKHYIEGFLPIERQIETERYRVRTHDDFER